MRSLAASLRVSSVTAIPRSQDVRVSAIREQAAPSALKANNHVCLLMKGDITVMSMNFERWLRVPQLAIGYLSPLRRAAPARAARRRPARLAALVGGAALCTSLAMTAASVPADARSASAPAGVVSTESERTTADEFRVAVGTAEARAAAMEPATPVAATEIAASKVIEAINPDTQAAATGIAASSVAATPAGTVPAPLETT